MPDNRSNTHDCQRRENICIDTYRILDSCKDKDCFENTRLMLTDYGQDIIEKCGSVRVKNTKIVWTDINIDAVKFNKGFYQVSIRYFTKVVLEACVCLGKIQEIEGIAVNEKKVVLFGGDGNVNIFRSSNDPNEFCTCGSGGETATTNKPSVVVEVVDPIALSVKISENETRCSCCCADELPANVSNFLNGNISDNKGCRGAYVSLGYFSVIRMERPTQLVVSATEYSVPDKVCTKATDEDPCALFAKMNFPTSEFYTSQCPCE